MGRGKAITPYERGQVEALSKTTSKRQIAKKLHRSVDLVINCLDRGTEHEPRVSTGRRRHSSDTTIRHIHREASNNTKSSSRIKADLQLQESSRTVRRIINTSEHLQYEKMLSRPQLKAVDKVARLQWARNHMQWSTEWYRTIFSDEKKFNLDGPDGFSYYWHDLRKAKRIFSKRNYGGGSLMIWVAISKDFKSELYVLDGTLNAERYTQLLGTSLLPLCQLVNAQYPDGAIFQHDLASAHTAHLTSNWLQHHNITQLPWVSHSPDLNITENIFGMLSREVYEDCRHYTTVEELRDAILTAWHNIGQETIRKLFDSIPERIFELIEKNGGSTHY